MKMVGLMMGAWFLASGAGNSVAALIAQATAAPGADGENQVLAVYSKVGWIAIGAGVLMMIAAPMITKYMHLDTLQDDNVEGNIEEKTA